jgi:phosphoribosyl-AMP cyclohydrolase / phosphoribosyl-ATP pyrophosphohydrolase
MRDRDAPLSAAEIDSLAWDKMDGLLPAIVQDTRTLQVLMLGYISREALARTLETGYVTFHSRSKGRLWTKGETSGNRLVVRAVLPDCDSDALLIEADPEGPACHLGTPSCFSEAGPGSIGWLGKLARIVEQRAAADAPESYTARLLVEGPIRIAQKIGEEGVELALAGAAGDRDACIAEAADLVFHMTVLMQSRGFGWEDLTEELRRRHGRN